MTSAQALHDLGVRDDMLSADEQAFLDANGYLPLPGILSDDQLAAIRQRIEAILVREGEAAGHELAESEHIRHPREAGADRLSDLVNKGAVFEVCFAHPRVLAGIAHVLGTDLKLSSLNYRAARPGMGLQKLHADWHEAVAPGDYQVCNSIWLLDDFTSENGATRVVPGTHRSGKLPQDVLDDPEAPHPNEALLTAPAGTVVIFNSHTWHGGTTNRTAHPRRAIHSYWCRRDRPQQIDQQRYIRPETLERMPEAARVLLDVDDVMRHA